uniref:Uncharacterized protein n=1 Tax=Anopheles coluzzii TaxID=1518534 RepID=A0A8W7PWI6_ANOCL
LLRAVRKVQHVCGQLCHLPWRCDRVQFGHLDAGGQTLHQRAARYEPVLRCGVRADRHLRPGLSAVVLRMHGRGQGVQVYAADVLHPSVSHLRDDADRRHPGVRVPREGVANDGRRDALVHEPVRFAPLDHDGLGRNAGAAEVLRRPELQRLAGRHPAVLLPADARWLQAVHRKSEPGEHLHQRVSGDHLELHTRQCGHHRWGRYRGGGAAHLRHDILLLTVPDDRIDGGVLLPSVTTVHNKALSFLGAELLASEMGWCSGIR